MAFSFRNLFPSQKDERGKNVEKRPLTAARSGSSPLVSTLDLGKSPESPSPFGHAPDNGAPRHPAPDASSPFQVAPAHSEAGAPAPGSGSGSPPPDARDLPGTTIHPIAPGSADAPGLLPVSDPAAAAPPPASIFEQFSTHESGTADPAGPPPLDSPFLPSGPPSAGAPNPAASPFQPVPESPPAASTFLSPFSVASREDETGVTPGNGNASAPPSAPVEVPAWPPPPVAAPLGETGAAATPPPSPFAPASETAPAASPFGPPDRREVAPSPFGPPASATQGPPPLPGGDATPSGPPIEAESAAPPFSDPGGFVPLSQLRDSPFSKSPFAKPGNGAPEISAGASMPSPFSFASPREEPSAANPMANTPETGSAPHDAKPPFELFPPLEDEPADPAPAPPLSAGLPPEEPAAMATAPDPRTAAHPASEADPLPAAADAAPASADGPSTGEPGDDHETVDLPLGPLLSSLDAKVLGFDPAKVPSHVGTAIPLEWIRSQFAGGRVVLPLERIIAGCDERFHRAFAAADRTAEVRISTGELTRHLPPEALASITAVSAPAPAAEPPAVDPLSFFGPADAEPAAADDPEPRGEASPEAFETPFSVSAKEDALEGLGGEPFTPPQPTPSAFSPAGTPKDPPSEARPFSLPRVPEPAPPAAKTSGEIPPSGGASTTPDGSPTPLPFDLPRVPPPADSAIPAPPPGRVELPPPLVPESPPATAFHPPRQAAEPTPESASAPPAAAEPAARPATSTLPPLRPLSGLSENPKPLGAATPPPFQAVTSPDEPDDEADGLSSTDLIDDVIDLDDLDDPESPAAPATARDAEDTEAEPPAEAPPTDAQADAPAPATTPRAAETTSEGPDTDARADDEDDEDDDLTFGYQMDDPSQLALRAVFETQETLDLTRALELSGRLPGIAACIYLDGHRSLAVGEAAPDEAFEAKAPEVYRNVRDLAGILGIGDATTFTIRTDHGVMSFFTEGDACLAVLHRNGRFLPGIREKLALVTRELPGLALPS